VVWVPAARPGAVQRPGREDAPLVDLATHRADDRKAGQIPLLCTVTHAIDIPAARSARTRSRMAKDLLDSTGS
jgi:hypothetical protein